MSLGKMRSVLIVGPTSGLGASLKKYYAAQPFTSVYATARSSSTPESSPTASNIKWNKSVDSATPTAGTSLASHLKGQSIDITSREMSLGKMRSVLIVGATRGLGASLVKYYAAQPFTTVYATARSSSTPESSPTASNIKWINSIDIATPTAGTSLASHLKGQSIDITIIAAGWFRTETFDEPNWEDEIKMYTVCTMGPQFVVQALVKAGLCKKGSKILLLSSEAGSITLRCDKEGGGNYAHHASKTALNMVGKLLSLDIKDKEIALGMIHPGFLMTEMTKSAGFDKFYEIGGAIPPEEGAKSLADFIETFGMTETGQFWAPRGPEGIGNVEETIGKRNELPTPLQLPW